VGSRLLRALGIESLDSAALWVHPREAHESGLAKRRSDRADSLTQEAIASDLDRGGSTAQWAGPMVVAQQVARLACAPDCDGYGFGFALAGLTLSERR
jgi:hypothetical protein